MGFNWKAVGATAALALLAVACNDLASPKKTLSPGVRRTVTVGTQIFYTGQGFTDGQLNNSFCETPNDGGTGYKPALQPNDKYLLFVLTGTGATQATLYGLPESPIEMVKVGGTFKVVTPYYSFDDLTDPANHVYALFSPEDAGANSQLVVSHGCDGGTGHPQGSSIVTEVHLAETHALVSAESPAALGSTVHDKAVVTTDGNVAIPDGSKVQFYFWKNGSCRDTPFAGPTEYALTGTSYDGGLPEGPLGAGAYSYKAFFKTGNPDLVSDSEGECEPLAISKKELEIRTKVHNASDANITSTSVDLGSVIHDYAEVTGAVSGFTPANSVTFRFFTDIACTGDGTAVDNTGTEGSGVRSASTAALGAGSYGFRASLAGDDNYTVKDVTGCEPVTVNKGTLHISTQVHDASHNDVTNKSVVSGSIIHDYASVTGAVSSIAPANAVTFRFYTNGACTGDGAPAANAGAEAPGVRSANSAALTVGSYAYHASLAGDNNYDVIDDTPCEPVGIFALGKTMGFWGNTNGIARITAAGGWNSTTFFFALGRGSKIDTKEEAAKIFPNMLNACGKGSPPIFSVGSSTASANCTLSSGLNIGTLNTATAQTLALGLNIRLVNTFAGNSVGAFLCSATGITGLTNSSSVQNVFDQAVLLINGSYLGGSTTQSQLGLMNTLMGCLNREA